MADRPSRSTLLGASRFRRSQAANERWGRLRVWPVQTSGELVGGCELRLREDEIADLSYWTLAGHRGKGHATRAVRLACQHAFTEMGIERIALSIEPDNAPSLAISRAAGFTEEGTLRRCVVLLGKRYDVVLLSRLVTDTPT